MLAGFTSRRSQTQTVIQGGSSSRDRRISGTQAPRCPRFLGRPTMSRGQHVWTVRSPGATAARRDCGCWTADEPDVTVHMAVCSSKLANRLREGEPEFLRERRRIRIYRRSPRARKITFEWRVVRFCARRRHTLMRADAVGDRVLSLRSSKSCGRGLCVQETPASMRDFSRGLWCDEVTVVQARIAFLNEPFTRTHAARHQARVSAGRLRMRAVPELSQNPNC
jgi:hypothetical protein